MTPRIAAVATAVPPYRYTQAQILALAGYADERRRGFFAASDIEGRHLWIDPARFTPNETVDELNARFCEGALALAESAARATLARAGWTPEDVDFIATTTCTGRLTPSLDAHLVARLGCRAEVQRVHVGDTGCASAMVALQQAWNHLQAFPRHRALVTAVEICSAAYFLDDRLARAVLREHGNISSATILFVLERLLRLEHPVPGQWGLMIGLGPGFAAEGALLRW